MKRYSVLAVVMFVAVLVAGPRVVGALSVEGPLILTEAQTETIADNCTVSKIALGQVHSNDAAMRVNIGQEYANISSRLMAPLNSRISLAGRDGVQLTQITADYNTVLQEFRAAYRLYDNAVLEALGIDCRTKQAEYYAAVLVARQERAKVREAVSQLSSLATEYRSGVTDFRHSLGQD